MVEPKATTNIFDLSKQLNGILDEILATGDWESSLFLKGVATKLQKIRNENEKLANSGTVTTQVVNVVDTTRKPAPAGYVQVFVLIYQAVGSDLPGWFANIKTLADYSGTRPVYKDEAHIKEFIRAKTATMDRNAYVVVNIKESDFEQTGEQIDQFNHQLFLLKQGSLKLENVVEFVHLNKKRYAMGDKELVYLGDVN
jgi:hypothetical protein